MIKKERDADGNVQWKSETGCYVYILSGKKKKRAEAISTGKTTDPGYGR